jgi:UDP-glucose:(heptosyl)LPS alpha-1,3-glucosyltransferase
VSNGTLADLRRDYSIRQIQAVVIPLGCDHMQRTPVAADRVALRKQLNMRKRDLIALFVGGDWQRKGLEMAMRGVALATGWQLMVVGPGSRQRFEELAHSAGLDGRATFVESPRDIGAFYGAADAFLLPSKYEGFSLGTFEAAAAGLPLLATAVNGVTDILRDGKNGWVLSGGAEEIADRLDRLRDADLRASMGAASRSSVADYTWERAVNDYCSLMEQIDPGGLR